MARGLPVLDSMWLCRLNFPQHILNSCKPLGNKQIFCPPRYPALLVFAKAPMHKCPLCPYTSKYPGNVHRHKQRHAAVKTKLCTVPGCEAAFTTNLDLKKHAKVHSGLGAAACPHGCGYSAVSHARLRSHTLQCPSGVGAPPLPTRTFACGLPGCSYTSKRHNCVLLHQRRMHDPANGGALTCSRCGFVAETHKALLSHSAIAFSEGERRWSPGAPQRAGRFDGLVLCAVSKFCFRPLNTLTH